ncbi:hypothetical protein [Hyphomicrobium sp. ghe19]|uniref:hypothetical protein n=1 Tax=Hyphomicrobium sp. ghe19 TaxID=2682968 RepID=UPI0013679450|nr:hypothetical protein HYPP_00307 [Hyphomicrobium sp. ghe19]
MTTHKRQIAMYLLRTPASGMGYLLVLFLGLTNAFAGASSSLSPQEAGARYGEALGAIEVCDGTALTDKAKNLKASFAGAELDRFTAQAAKIYSAWVTVKNCVHQNDPNPCRIIIQKSCLEATSEIGPQGSALPGLLDVQNR